MSFVAAVGALIDALDSGVNELPAPAEPDALSDVERQVLARMHATALGILAEREHHARESKALAAANVNAAEVMCRLEEARVDLERKQAMLDDLVSRQEATISELSTPVLQLWDGVLAMPLIGVIDARRSSEMTERLLSDLVERQAHHVILDITGVEVVDEHTAQHLVQMVQAARLLGAECVLTGVRPAVARTLVRIGVDLSSLKTITELSGGLRYCLRSNPQTGLPREETCRKTR